MNQNLIEIICVLDRSGSMNSLTADTIGGYNEFIEKQKSNGKTTNVSLVLFDDKYDLIYDCKNINEIRPLDTTTYFARGMTALYDAIGKTINNIGERLSKTDESKKPSKIIFLIITDGYENASKEFTSDKVKEMIKHQTNIYSWEFIFLGANIDSFNVSNNLGISSNNTANYKATNQGIRGVFKASARYTSDLVSNLKNIDIQSYVDKTNK